MNINSPWDEMLNTKCDSSHGQCPRVPYSCWERFCCAVEMSWDFTLGLSFLFSIIIRLVAWCRWRVAVSFNLCIYFVKATFLLLLVLLVKQVPAPVPRCSPWIIINKLVEWNSLWSDSNAYFPVGPCEYGGPIGALLAGDTDAVFLLNQPEKIPRHNLYEFVWFLKTGLLRGIRMMLGLEPFEADINILLEGYQHYTPWVQVLSWLKEK